MSSSYFETVDSANTTAHKRGVTVKLYKEETQFEYPYLLLSCEKLEEFRVDVLKGILAKRSLLEVEGYSVYVMLKGECVKIGFLKSEMLKSIIGNKVFNVFKKQMFLDKDTVIEGDMLFALCPVTVEY